MSNQASPTPETITEAVQFLTAAGYVDELVVTPDGLARRSGDGVEPYDTALVEHLFRFEGDSDPADESIVVGVACPSCGFKGTIVAAYGPAASNTDVAMIRSLLDKPRPSGR